MVKRIKSLGILILYAFLHNACSFPPPVPTGTFVWIDVPVNGLTIPAGQSIRIEGHASSTMAVSRIEVWIDGSLFLEMDDPPSKGTLAHFEEEWLPPGPGDYTIQALAFGSDGSTSTPDNTTIHVFAEATKSSPTNTGEAASVTPTIPITGTLTPGTSTFTPTWTLTAIPPTWTPIPPTWTFTPHPPTPTFTNTPTPPDTTPPPSPGVVSPVGSVMLACSSSATLEWSKVTDPSGISEYRVEVQKSSDGSNWTTLSGSPWNGLSPEASSMPITVECGWYYRWRVSAVDGAGNASPWSDWAQFAITIT